MLRKFLAQPTLADVVVPLSFDQLVQRTRILVIDDADNEFPFQFFKSNGYSIDHWRDIEDVAKLETGFYDIIILDIGGVGTRLDPQQEGVAVLTHIKKVNPSQVVIAHSGQSYAPSRIPFFRLADQFVPKPTTSLVWKETLDELIKSTMTASHYWRSISAILNASGVDKKTLARVESEIAKSIRSKDHDLGTRLKALLGVADNVSQIVAIATKLVAIVS